eukprot:3771785-Pyramimonas_sp.AAC.1
MSNYFHNLRHQREDAVIVVGAINIGARNGHAFVGAKIVTNIATIIIASTVVGVAMIPRLPKSPTRRSDAPSGQRHRGRVGGAKTAGRCAR